MIKAVSDAMLNRVVQGLKSLIGTKASEDHNHDGTYSDADHNHTAEDVGAAPADHNHDGTYAPADHDHEHNHDDLYSKLDHTHPEKLLYGEELPAAGDEGRVFILKAKEAVIAEQTIESVTGNYRLYLVVDGRIISNENMTINYRLGMARVSEAGSRFNQYSTGWDIKINGKQVSYSAKSDSPKIGFETDSVMDIPITSGTATVSYEAGVSSIPVRVDIDMTKNVENGAPGPMTAEGSIDISHIITGGIYVDNGSEWELYFS